jgi:two-component system, OmpR family, response regulator
LSLKSADAVIISTLLKLCKGKTYQLISQFLTQQSQLHRYQSTFQACTVPVVADGIRVSALSLNVKSLGRTLGIKTVVVDDSAFLREQLIGVLCESKGIEVVGQAQNAQMALRLTRELKPNVVILDIELVGGKGVTVLEKVKQERDAPVVVVFTNLATPQYREKCLEAGADFFIDKSTGLGGLKQIFQGLSQRSNALAVE